jgi:cyclic-di-GMP-binding protein
MAKDSSFDVVSDYDVAEMANAVDQAQRELGIRYDFRGTTASVEFAEGKTGLALTGDSEVQLQAILDVVQSKLLKRNLSLKTLDTSATPVQGGKEMRWAIAFRKGLDQEKAKAVTRTIRDSHPKAKSSIQGDEVRVVSASRDELQAVMTTLRAAEFDFPIEFTNYR